MNPHSPQPKKDDGIDPEDEVSIAEPLVYEGTDEAEGDRRLAAADRDFEP